MIKFHVISHKSLASTQTFMETNLLKEDMAEGTVIWAFEQHAGFGQEGNKWVSNPGENLTFSVLLKPEFLEASTQFLLNQSIALAVTDYLETKQGIKPQIKLKWPNDFYIGEKKTGGMILNNAVVGNSLRYCIAGIGLNFNQLSFPTDCPNPTSLRLETADQYSLKDELEELLLHIKERYHLLRSKSIRQIQNDYLTKLFLLNISAQYSLQGKTIEGVIRGVDEYGRLLLEQKGDKMLCCDVKEITYLPQQPLSAY